MEAPPNSRMLELITMKISFWNLRNLLTPHDSDNGHANLGLSCIRRTINTCSFVEGAGGLDVIKGRNRVHLCLYVEVETFSARTDVVSVRQETVLDQSFLEPFSKRVSGFVFSAAKSISRQHPHYLLIISETSQISSGHSLETKWRVRYNSIRYQAWPGKIEFSWVGFSSTAPRPELGRDRVLKSAHKLHSEYVASWSHIRYARRPSGTVGLIQWRKITTSHGVCTKKRPYNRLFPLQCEKLIATWTRWRFCLSCYRTLRMLL